MRKWKTVFWTIIFVCVSPAVMHGEEPNATEHHSDNGQLGIVSGLVNTVTKTVSNTGEAVKQTVETTGQTIKQTADFAEETVKTIARPPAEKSVTQTVKPVVSQTTETVQKTVDDTAELVKELPEIPVATPVVEESVYAVGETIDHTADYADETTAILTSTEPEKPVKQVLQNTGQLVSETAETTVPVVESTMKAVESVSNELTGVAKEIPVVSHAAPVVEETVMFTANTVNSTADTVNKTVRNVTTPTNQPILQTAKDTAEFIGETVSDTVPIVEKTTGMVQGVVQDVSQTTDALPEIPVVTPVVEQVKDLVNGTVNTVKEVTNQTVTETVVQANEIIRPTGGASHILPLEKPVVVTKPITNMDKVNSAENAVRVPMVPLQESAVHSKEDTEKLVNETPGKLVIEEPSKKAANVNDLKGQQAFEPFTEQQERAPVISDSSFRVELPEMNAESREDKFTEQAIPPVKETNGTVAESPAIFITSGSSSTMSSASGSHIDVSAGLWSEQLQAIRTVSKRWYLEHLLGKVQWTHPPPGQPPQTTPFLYVSI